MEEHVLTFKGSLYKHFHEKESVTMETTSRITKNTQIMHLLPWQPQFTGNIFLRKHLIHKPKTDGGDHARSS